MKGTTPQQQSKKEKQQVINNPQTNQQTKKVQPTICPILQPQAQQTFEESKWWGEKSEHFSKQNEGSWPPMQWHFLRGGYKGGDKVS